MPPSTHVALFVGDYPCDKEGRQLHQIGNAANQKLAENLAVNCSFSSKPAGGYKDYHQKMTTYIAIISAHAQAIDPEATAKTFAPVESDEADSVSNISMAANGEKISTANADFTPNGIRPTGMSGVLTSIAVVLIKK